MTADTPAGTAPAHVAAIVVGTNERHWLPECLATLCAGGDGSVRLQVYYVDNASGDGSVDYVRRHHPNIVVISNHANLGFADANNVGMRAALDGGAEHIFLVNPDTSTPPGLVPALARFLGDWPGYGIVGPMQWRYTRGEPVRAELNEWSWRAVADGEQHVLARDLPSLRPHTGVGPRAPGTLEFAYVQGAALYARSAMLRQIGLFDEAYHTFYEEVDLCRRARLAGWRVALLTDLGIGHHGGGSTAGTAYRRRQMMRNKYYYMTTDVEMPALARSRISLGWLARDLRGRGIGGHTSVPMAVAEMASSAWWLALQAGRIAHRRRQNRALLAAATADPAPWQDRSRSGFS